MLSKEVSSIQENSSSQVNALEILQSAMKASVWVQLRGCRTMGHPW